MKWLLSSNHLLFYKLIITGIAYMFFFEHFLNCVVLIQNHCCFSPSRYVTHIPVYCIFLWLLPTLFLLVVLGSEVEADYLLCPFITRKPRWTEHVTDFRLDVQVKVLLSIRSVFPSRTCTVGPKNNVCARTRQPPQEEKVPYFCSLPVRTLKSK